METIARPPEPFVIHDRTIAPGTSEILSIPVSQQVTGLESSLALKVLHGNRRGPAVFVSAAIHGDEIVGTAIIQRLLDHLLPDEMAGTLILAPAVNIYGFAAHSRYLPDRRDLNRSFPGHENGSLAAQLAHCFLTHVIDRCALGIDMHTAAVHRYNLPQVRIAADSPYLSELAMAFGAPITIESPLRPGSTRWRERGSLCSTSASLKGRNSWTGYNTCSSNGTESRRSLGRSSRPIPSPLPERCSRSSPS